MKKNQYHNQLAWEPSFAGKLIFHFKDKPTQEFPNQNLKQIGEGVHEL